MVKGGTNIRKSIQRRYQKRKVPPGKKKVLAVNVVEDMMGKVSGTSVDEVVIEPSKQTISEVKIKEIPIPDNTEEFTAPTGYRFMDTSILGTVFSMVSCPQCYCTSLNLVQNRKQGLSFGMKLVCGSIDCDWCHISWTSKKRSKNYDVNRRKIYSMRRIGSGYAGMKRFLVLMNHPSSMTEQNYRKLSSVYRNSVKEVAETVMQEAALEIYNKNTLIVMITLLILVFLLMVPA